MISRMEKIRLGVFLLVSASVLVVTAVVLAGMNLMKSMDEYYVRYKESVSGLEMGAQVKFNGVRVGQVSDIRLIPDSNAHVEVELELRKGTPVTVDTKAVLTGMGITGLKFVELRAGSKGSAKLAPGGQIKAGHSLMGTLGGKAEDITVKTDLVLSKINAVLSEQTILNIEGIIEDVKNITGSTEKVFSENDHKIAVILDDVSQATEDLREGAASVRSGMALLDNTIETASPGVEESVRNLTEITRSVKKTARDLSQIEEILNRMRASLQDFQTKLASVDVSGISNGIESTVNEANSTLASIRRVVDSSTENIYRSTYSLKRTLRNLEEFSAAIRDQPSLLLSKKKTKDRPEPED